jgi:hypothetical protein
MNQTLRVVCGEFDPYIDRSQKNVRFVAYVMDVNNAAVVATVTLTLIDGLGNSVGPTTATAGTGALGTSITPLGSYYVDQDLTGTLIGPAQLIGTWTATSGALTAQTSFSTQIIDSLDRTY